MKKNRSRRIALGLSLAAVACLAPACARRFDNLGELGSYDVIWDRAGNGSKGSMPAGNELTPKTVLRKDT